jgi:hypothetical protein
VGLIRFLPGFFVGFIAVDVVFETFLFGLSFG